MKMTTLKKHKPEIFKKGFTFVEIIIVMVILVIAAMVAIPMMSSAADMQVRSAANIIVADLEYAKSLAICQQQNYSVVFNTANDSYELRDKDGVVISHPARPSQSFAITFPDDRRLRRVNIETVSFDTNPAVTFDYLGGPYSGIGVANPLNSGQIILEAESCTATITVEPVTGYITIQ